MNNEVYEQCIEGKRVKHNGIYRSKRKAQIQYQSQLKETLKVHYAHRYAPFRLRN